MKKRPALYVPRVPTKASSAHLHAARIKEAGGLTRLPLAAYSISLVNTDFQWSISASNPPGGKNTIPECHSAAGKDTRPCQGCERDNAYQILNCAHSLTSTLAPYGHTGI